VDLAIDSANPANVYITGWTCSTNFPTTSNAYQPTFTPPACGGYASAFVTKLNPALSGLSALQYSTYLGGNTGEATYGIAVDATGNIYVTGNTASSNFPAWKYRDRAYRYCLYDIASLWHQPKQWSRNDRGAVRQCQELGFTLELDKNEKATLRRAALELPRYAVVASCC
jgi:hypothetical protein